MSKVSNTTFSTQLSTSTKGLLFLDILEDSGSTVRYLLLSNFFDQYH